jgi:hypothetical protein
VGPLTSLPSLKRIAHTNPQLPANLVLQDTIERIYVQSYYADNPHGVFIVRGENVLLLGEIVPPLPKT